MLWRSLLFLLLGYIIWRLVRAILRPSPPRTPTRRGTDPVYPFRNIEDADFKDITSDSGEKKT